MGSSLAGFSKLTPKGCQHCPYNAETVATFEYKGHLHAGNFCLKRKFFCKIAWECTLALRFSQDFLHQDCARKIISYTRTEIEDYKFSRPFLATTLKRG